MNLEPGQDGWKRVMREPERVGLVDWRVMRLRRYTGWPNWIAEYVREAILNLMRCFILSQWSDLREG